MKKIIKKTISLLLCLALLSGITVYSSVTAEVKAAQAELLPLTTGKCGAKVTYSFDSITGVLIIKGKGDMADFDANDNKSPFSGRDEIRSVYIDDGVTNIGEWAFYDCFKLNSVSFGKDVKTVSGCAFYGCVDTGSVMMQEGLTVIEERAFEHCIALKEIKLPESVIYIGERAFDNTGYYRKKSNWENSALYLGNFLLTGTYNDAYLDSKKQGSKPYVSDVHQVYKPSMQASGNYAVKEGTAMIVDGAFQSCGITGVTIPDSVKRIGYGAFAHSGLTSIVIPGNITTIEEGTFSYCSSLKSVTIPKSVKEIGERAFYNCKSLAKITIPTGIVMIDDEVFGGCGLTGVTIPKNVKGVGEGAFGHCDSLKRVTIKSGVRVIGAAAFRDCEKLKSVTVPKSVKTIGQNAFGFKRGDYNEKVSGFKLKGYKGSAAQKYAKNYKVKFVVVSKK